MFAKEGIIHRQGCTLKENGLKHSKYLAVEWCNAVIINSLSCTFI